jgi:hypothetical protein
VQTLDHLKYKDLKVEPILSKEELAYAGELLQNNGPAKFYTYLSERGFQYATLSLGVANEDSKLLRQHLKKMTMT